MANAIWQATIVDQSGNVLPGAEVEVVNESTGLSAPLFTTRTGTTKSNPFFADANGFAQFYAAPGLYRITATSSGTGNTMTWRNVRLVDIATNAEALAGTAGVVPDAAGVRAAFGQYGLGAVAKFKAIDWNIEFDDYNNSTGVILSDSGSTNGPPEGLYFYPDVRRIASSDNMTVIAWPYGGGGSDNPFYRTRSGGIWGTWKRFLSSGNTTVDVNGFIKAASPIAKLHSDRIEKNGEFTADFERIGTGHYLIKNTLGFAQEGWYVETPKDANGNIKVFVEYEDNNGDITVKTYEPDYSTGRVTAGAPVDIPNDRWIDIRLHELPTEPVDEESKE